MISIIHPSRGRPDKSLKTITKWIMNASDVCQCIVAVDLDDQMLGVYQDMYIDLCKGDDLTELLIKPTKSAVDAINYAASVAHGDILIVVSDDTEPIPEWDKKILDFVKDKKDWILKTQDGIQKWIITMPIMDRAYYRRFGYIYYPEYKHMFCDTELTMVADLTGRKITSNLMFPHKQYSVTGEKPDEINKRADATWNHGEKLFLERLKRNFDLKPEDIKGKVTDPSYINWARSKGVRV